MPPGEAVRSTLIALVSTIVIFGVLAVVITSSPNWPDVQDKFFNGPILASSWPKIIEAFGTNIALFVIAELLILPFAL
ncbi:MAG TPA: amino acid ABC transporter permease, partial [Verrucomicrobiae bacterium]|nr:amino acid ABC transporter permease [Verrucomicrobiae bacterium]